MLRTVSTLLLVATTAATYALNPSRTYKQYPDKYNMIYEEVKVATHDGDAELNAWYFPNGSRTTKLMLISHNGEGNMADQLRRVDMFISQGFNVMIYDYRGFGTSSEFAIDNNMYIYPHFQDDLQSMIDYCRQTYAETFDLYGWGIGGGLSLGIGWNRPEIKHIISDTPFLSMEDLEKRFSNWDEPMEVPFAGYEKRFEPLYALDQNPSRSLAGVLLIVGSDDVLFSSEDYEALHEKQKNYVEIEVIDNPDHQDNFAADKAGYWKLLEEFLGE